MHDVRLIFSLVGEIDALVVMVITHIQGKKDVHRELIPIVRMGMIVCIFWCGSVAMCFDLTSSLQPTIRR